MPALMSSTGDTSVETSTPTHPITSPYITSCLHTYCYLCISERLIRAVDEGGDGEEGWWECLRCEEPVRSCERVEGVYSQIRQGDASSDGFSDLGEGVDTASMDSDDFPSGSSALS